MKTLNLSSHLKFYKYPLINFNKFNFKSGEEHIKIENQLNKYDKILLVSTMAEKTLSSDITTTLLATDALKEMGVKHIELFTPYFPFSRQDRVMVNGEPFSLRVMAKQINSQKYKKVHILNPHSNITNVLVNNIQLIDDNKFIEKCWMDIKDDNKCLISPDAGAEKNI